LINVELPRPLLEAQEQHFLGNVNRFLRPGRFLEQAFEKAVCELTDQLISGIFLYLLGRRCLVCIDVVSLSPLCLELIFLRPLSPIVYVELFHLLTVKCKKLKNKSNSKKDEKNKIIIFFQITFLAVCFVLAFG